MADIWSFLYIVYYPLNGYGILAIFLRKNWNTMHPCSPLELMRAMSAKLIKIFKWPKTQCWDLPKQKPIWLFVGLLLGLPIVFIPNKHEYIIYKWPTRSRTKSFQWSLVNMREFHIIALHFILCRDSRLAITSVSCIDLLWDKSNQVSIFSGWDVHFYQHRL